MSSIFDRSIISVPTIRYISVIPVACHPSISAERTVKRGSRGANLIYLSQVPSGCPPSSPRLHEVVHVYVSLRCTLFLPSSKRFCPPFLFLSLSLCSIVYYVSVVIVQRTRFHVRRKGLHGLRCGTISARH